MILSTMYNKDNIVIEFFLITITFFLNIINEVPVY